MVGGRSDSISLGRDRHGTVARSKHLTPEMYFLIAKFLSNGPCQKALQALREEIEEHNLMPKRIDWQGKEHALTFDEVNRSAGHIKPDHLSTLCSIALTLSEQSSSHPLRRSLLGLSMQSMLGPKTNPVMNESSLVLKNGVPPLPTVQNLANDPSNLVRALVSRETIGHSKSLRTTSCDIYHKIKSHTRMLGHLSAVYCVGFDRTGRYIFTGADDRLLKIWSATDGRLLSTLRGHDGEITDFAVNYENTLLASASCDKTIRIWDLRTTAPVTILVGHQQQVTSVKFCPYVGGRKRYLTSTGNDSAVCFWPYDPSNNEFDPKPIKFNEKIKSSCHILTSSFSAGGMFMAIGTNDKYVRVYLVDGPRGPEKIMEIEAHNDNVDSLQFSNRSMRFISGSKDGTAFVWSYERQTWKNLPLRMIERLPSDPILDEDEMVKVKVNMVCWTCDDQYVITSASDHSIKVWNPETGKLIHSLRDHDDDVFCIESHPKDPRIFLTGGHGGRVIIWNVITGKPINIFTNMIDGQGHASIYDIRFSPDGLTIASTDSHGHLKIYGFGSSEKYDKIPRDVFFHTDYRPLVRDTNHYVIDEQTQCPPHLMPPPFLVDIDGNPHPPQYQRLVPGRENCNEQQLVPQIAIQNVQGVGEVLEAAIQDPILPPIPIIQDRAPTIDDMIQRLAREQGVHGDHGYAAAVPAQAPEVRHRNPSGSAHVVGPRREGDVEGVRQIRVFREAGAPGPPLYRVRKVVTPLSSSELNTMRGRLKQLASFEKQYYEQQLRKRPAAAPVPREDLKQKKVTRRKRRIAQQYHGLNQGRPVNRRVLARDPDIPEMSESSHAGSGAESWAESSSESESETEDSEEDAWDGTQGRRTRAARRVASPSCWQRDCVDLISYLFTLKDSIPFRFPVDLLQYPDYNTVVDTPMDLMTIKEQLTADSYESHHEFKKDLDLVFENSKKYTPDRHSKIYAMTVRMSNLCNSKYREIVSQKYRSANSKKEVRESKRRIKKRKRSDDSDWSNAADQPGPSRVQVSRKPVRKTVLKNGQAKSEDFYKALVQSDESEEEEEINGHLDNGSETEIEERPDSDATEIDDEEEPIAKTKKSGEKRKAPIKASAPKKKSRANSGSDTEFECDDQSTSRSGSRASFTASSFGSRDTPTDMEKYGRKGSSRRGDRHVKTRTRNGGVRRVKYREDDSDYEYGDPGTRGNAQGVSSRGRVIKFKGHARTSQVC